MNHLWKRLLTSLFFLITALNAPSLFGQISFEDAFSNISFNFPLEIQHANDGTNRLFVVEQPGVIKVFPNTPGVTNAQVSTFLDISSKVAYSSGQEIGLLGLAFHPNFASNRYIYVYYTDSPSNYRINVSRFQVNATDPNTVDIGSEVVIARFLKNQSNSNHNGGKIAFGPDGYLYISIGDGGGAGDPQKNAQNLNIPFGSILRIDVDLDGSNPVESNPELPDGNYEIPTDNPRVGLSGLDEIYAWGIRNTWKFSFDSSGKLWGADVGQGAYEEINIVEKGGNYGWNKFEANSEPSYGSATTLVTTPDIKPIFYYDHTNGDVSITGGYFYKGSLTNAALQNKYIYADYVSGRVWALTYNSSTGSVSNQLLFKTNGQFISSFGEDQNGELYFSDYGSSAKLYKLTETVTGPVTVEVEGVGDWENLASGTNGIVETIASDDDGTLYIGGSFTNAGGVGVSNLARYLENAGWQGFGSGTNGTVFSIAVASNGNVYVAGDFTQVNGVNANNIALWNGTNWTALGIGSDGPIAKVEIGPTGDVFVGGVFTTIGGVTANNIAKWNGSNWAALADGTSGIAGTNNEIRSMAFDETGTLYVGGNFDTAGGNSAARIARWNGTNWSGMGAGTSGFVQAILATDNYIYAGGNFAIAGSGTVNRIARWNRTSSTWEALDLGVSGNINALAHDGTYLYAGGSFDTSSEEVDVNEIMSNVARWSATNGWEALGPGINVGVNAPVNALAFIKNNTELMVGGNFSTAANRSANHIAKWGEEICNENSIIPEYQINGVWQSGSNTLNLNEGTQLTLSMLPNTTSFTITGPSGAVVNGDADLGTIDASDAGTYVITTVGGCTESIVLTVNNVSEEDADGDGVPDKIDICPNTPPGMDVDEEGCAISQIPVNNLTISSFGTSCIGNTDGQISIRAERGLTYTAVLTGSNSFSITETFSNNLLIEALSEGNYELCITATEYPDYESCSNVVVRMPPSLEVISIVDQTEGMVTLQMSGGKTYTVEHNQTTFKTSSNEVELKLEDGMNSVKVSTEMNCQGTFEDQILISEAAVIYPNPFESGFYLTAQGMIQKELTLRVFTLSGEEVMTKEIMVENQEDIYIDGAKLASGLYVVQLEYEGNKQMVKLVKR